ncbi:DEAD/DEAH box helicase [Mycobacterium sp. NPDC003323]
MTAPTTTPTTTFADLGVRDEIVRALAATGKEHPFAIQELTLPLALAGDDLIGQARTGMGKTLAFGVPLLHRISTDESRPLTGAPRALVVVPTRELCLQVFDDLNGAAKDLRAGDRKFTVTAIYGGRPYEPQIEALQKGVDVVVGTPGRLLDLAQQGHLQLGGLSVLVLDEADEMLDLGFLPDIERILKLTPDSRQAMLFSATMPDPIITLARTFMNQPTHIRAESAQSSQTHDTTEQFIYRAHALDKVEMVSRILQAEGRGATMIFTRTKRTAQKVADELGERGFKVGAVHGDLGQIAREKALKAFRTGDVDVLVATDVAARGIDIDDITHVINYQIPEDEQSYVHRIGRTGRAGKTGIAVTLVDWDELTRWSMIDKALGLDCPEPAETYSSSPHLYSELKIPAEATGSIAAPRTPKKRTEGERVERTERPARTRSRRRTRGGQPVTGHPESDDSATGSETGPESTSDTENGEAAPAKRRRRRRPRKTGAPATAE